VHQAIGALKGGRRNGAQILVERVRCRRQTPVVAVQPPIPVVAGIETEDPDATLEQIGREHGPDVTIHSGDENAHIRMLAPACGRMDPLQPLAAGLTSILAPLPMPSRRQRWGKNTSPKRLSMRRIKPSIGAS